MYNLQSYLNTSAEDAKLSLQCLLMRDPKLALALANQIIDATAIASNKKTLHKTALTIKKKAEKAIKEAA
ncbi:hypothetical protein [Shewanella acanthi]|uniref:hypothetical protein n=1 Tax=Shewanella acanthi TaxID=2864212 RepID=UPI001C656C69|nr:hypothetical protein [Shewanella acanthi]QYJ79396.1 hypothetical protein K0H61_02810 [Shewanella acanthi]